MKDEAAFGHGAENGHCCGLTKREWFAGMAMQGMVGVFRDYPEVAQRAYATADALLTQRSQARTGVRGLSPNHKGVMMPYYDRMTINWTSEKGVLLAKKFREIVEKVEGERGVNKVLKRLVETYVKAHTP